MSTETRSRIALSKKEAPTLTIPTPGMTTVKNRQVKLLIAGPIGTGKSTALMTLPGKKLIYAFDPNAIDSYPPADDWDILHFFPPANELDIAVKTLHAADKSAKHDRPSRGRERVVPLTYLRFEEDFTARCESGWFAENNYDWICYDSNTTFADICMDRIQYLNGRLGKHPEQADHTALMNLQRNIYRAAIGTGLNVAVTMHTEYGQDSTTNRISYQLMTTGRNKIRIPLLFSQIYGTERDTVDSKLKFTVHTVGGPKRDYCRTNVKGLSPEEDITVDFNQPLAGQGIGGFVLYHTKQ